MREQNQGVMDLQCQQERTQQQEEARRGSWPELEGARDPRSYGCPTAQQRQKHLREKYEHKRKPGHCGKRIPCART